MVNIRAYLATRGIAVVALFLALALPIPALAATFTNRYPVGALNIQPRVVSVTAFSTLAFDTRSVGIKVDGIAYNTLMQSGSASGYWLATEVWNPTLQAWTTKWSWVPTTADPNKITLYAYPVFSPPLADGIHTATATVKDRSGATFSESWTFTYGAPPTLGAPTPAHNSTVDTTMTPISVPATDNGPGTVTATATVNGAAAAASVSDGVVSVTPPVLANDASATVTVTVTDAMGYETSKTWSFWVQVYPEMLSTVDQCVSCHPTSATDPDMNANCALCHSGTLDRPHEGTPAGFHTRAPSQCSPCHVSEITVEHARHLSSAGTPITCLTCHGSTSPDVVGAIAAHQTACTSCHAGQDHASAHSKTTPAFCAKSGCHEPTNLLDEHITSPINPPSNLTCANCHSSTAPVVIAAIANHDRNCTTCHGQMLSGHDAMHESVMESECLRCHAGSISAEHIVLHNTGGTRTCSTCHESVEPRIVTAIANEDRTCSGCHDDAGHNAGHAADFSAQDCADCHVANVQTEHFRSTASSSAARCANCHLTPSSVTVDALGGAVWDKRCSQTGCHVIGSATQVHGSIDASHAVGVPVPACMATGCHSGTDLSVIHSAASTTTPEGTRTGCRVCHSAQALPASNQCVDCHPDRVATHGYDPVRHAAETEPCMGSCHTSDLRQQHGSLATPVSCPDCHPVRVAEVKPWNKTCGACHPTALHATANHAGTDAAVRAASLSNGGEERGCADTLPGQRGCHIITNLADLHLEAPGSCTICHGPSKTPAAECLTCHPTSGSGGGTPPETLETVSWYHHNNVKYLNNPADANPNPYYNSDGNPASGWFDSAYYQDCYDLCHHDYVNPGVFDAHTGQRMWFSAPGGYGGWMGPQIRTLTSAPSTLPAGAYLDFTTYYLLTASWGDGIGYVEISTDGGNSWTALTGTVNGASVAALTGSSAGWVSAHYDLGAYTGQRAQIRFRFDDQGGNCNGWALDDIAIGGDAGAIFSDGAETERPEWTNSYWIRSMTVYEGY